MIFLFFFSSHSTSTYGIAYKCFGSVFYIVLFIYYLGIFLFAVFGAFCVVVAYCIVAINPLSRIAKDVS